MNRGEERAVLSAHNAIGGCGLASGWRRLKCRSARLIEEHQRARALSAHGIRGCRGREHVKHALPIDNIQYSTQTQSSGANSVRVVRRKVVG